MKTVTPDVPKILRVFFILHFAVDFAFAVPLLIMPIRFLSFLGWTVVEPVTARLVAAALFGIGAESLLGNRSSIESFLSLLNLKIIWSVFAVCGMVISIAEMGWQAPPILWIVLGIFGGFSHHTQRADEDDAPRLRVTGVSIFGGVGIKTKPRKRRWRLGRGRGR